MANDRDFKRGEVYYVKFIKHEGENGRTPVIFGGHRAVVLFDSDFPSETVTVIPISSSEDENGNKKTVQAHFVELNKKEYQEAGFPYSNAIVKDSMIKTDQVTTVDRGILESLKGDILPRDMIELDVKLIDTLGLKDTLNTIMRKKVLEILSDYGIEVEEDDSERSE